MFELIRARIHRIPTPIRKVSVFIVGWLVILLGVAMLALPGPGWATIFLGFAILATEFASARQVKNAVVERLKQLIAWFKARFKKPS